MVTNMLDKNQTSSKDLILTNLKVNSGMSVDELAVELDITPMGVRQHLALMEREELVKKEKNRRPVGRPNFIYSLTEKAEDLFPKSYDDFITGILRDITYIDGEEKIKAIFEARKNRIYGSLQYRFAQEKLVDRVNTLSKHLNENDHFSVVCKEKQNIVLTKYNCPLLMISKEFPYLCQCEKSLYQALLAADVSIDHSQASGEKSCRFLIRSKKPIQ